jgi:hypothetical protein
VLLLVFLCVYAVRTQPSGIPTRFPLSLIPIKKQRFLFALPLLRQTNEKFSCRYLHERTFLVPVNLVNSDRVNHSYITIRNWICILSRLGLLEALLVEFDISFDYDVQPLTSAKHSFACSAFTLRRNSQLFLVFIFAFTYPFQYPYFLCWMFPAELILCPSPSCDLASTAPPDLCSLSAPPPYPILK